MKKNLYIFNVSAIAAFIFIAASARAADDSAVRYNDAQWKASHNSYHQQTNILSQLRDWRIRSIEFDIHTKKKNLTNIENAPDGDWLVYHQTGDYFTNCYYLSDCFSQVMEFHQAQPQHEVITIFFDMQGMGESGHTRDDLYALLNRSFPPGAILTPGDLLKKCAAAETLQQAVTMPGCGWPLLSGIKGQFILVVSGNELYEKTGYDIRKEFFFLTNGAEKEKDMGQEPDAVFFNMAGPKAFASTVKKAGFVSRCYWLNRQDEYQKAGANEANHLATDMIDPVAYPWANVNESPDLPYRVIGRQ